MEMMKDYARARMYYADICWPRTRLLPLHAQLFKRRKMQEGESLEDLDHVLDMADVFGHGFQLVVDITHAPQPLTLTMIRQFSMACIMEP